MKSDDRRGVSRSTARRFWLVSIVLIFFLPAVAIVGVQWGEWSWPEALLVTGTVAALNGAMLLVITVGRSRFVNEDEPAESWPRIIFGALRDGLAIYGILSLLYQFGVRF